MIICLKNRPVRHAESGAEAFANLMEGDVTLSDPSDAGEAGDLLVIGRLKQVISTALQVANRHRSGGGGTGHDSEGAVG